MILNTIDAYNFMSYEHLHIDFHCYSGIVGIFGNNGAGKSTILEAVYWCFTGSPLRNKMKVDNVVNEKISCNTCVSITFTQDNQEYIITRYRKDKKYDNALFFGTQEDPQCLTASDKKETQNNVYKILGINDITLRYIMFFGSEDIKPLVEMTDAEIKSLLEDVLGFNIIDKYSEFAKNMRKKLAPELETLRNNILRSSTLLDERRSLLEKEKKLLENLKDQAKYNINNLKKSNDIDVEALKLEKTKLLNQLAKIDAEKSKEDIYLKHIRDLEKKLKDAQMIYHEQYGRNMTLKHKLDELNNYEFPTECETCGRPYSVRSLAESKRRLKENIKEVKDAIKESDKNLKFAKKQLDEIQDIYNGYVLEYNDFKTFMSKFDVFKAELKNIEDQINNGLKQIRALEEHKEYYNTLIKDKEDQIALLQKSIQDIEDYLKEVKEIHDLTNEEYVVIGELIDLLGNKGVKEIYLDSVLPHLNQTIVDYIQALGNIDVVFNKTTSKSGNKFSIEVNNKNGSQDYFCNSSGEKVKVSIASSLAFHTFLREYLGITTNVLFLDEPFKALDQYSSEAVIELLKKVSETVPVIFLISHNEFTKNIVDDVIFIDKKNKVSYIKG